MINFFFLIVPIFHVLSMHKKIRLSGFGLWLSWEKYPRLYGVFCVYKRITEYCKYRDNHVVSRVEYLCFFWEYFCVFVFRRVKC